MERVLVLQGGGSLGAYECGVYKALARNDIRFDIVAGTSIGAVNASIIVAAKDDPAEALERFWLELAYTSMPSTIPDEMKHILTMTYNSLYGNPRVFVPRWLRPACIDSIAPYTWTYLYDIEPLGDTLARYVDQHRLRSRDGARLIVTATDILDGSVVVFDSYKMDIELKHIVASAAYPFYGLGWVRVGKRYLWDGSLLSNTPLREAMDASPRRDKLVFIVDLFPRRVERLPINMIDALHRARDILFTDKTYNSVRMSRVVSRYIRLLKEMHDILVHLKDGVQIDPSIRERLERLEREYSRLCTERGAMIREVVRIERKERRGTHSGWIFEDADFTLENIRYLIRQGERDCEMVLQDTRITERLE
ncbi:MAG: patatin-like phospholipase family protein [Candidatus Nitrosocaldus sp.]|nr:patatin-like phospholipase family protein [Candidatus Nitrosocaldus sp.]